ncbi:MAG: hypothetical protein M1818_006120 [Claussenomyces sp. TS43310]|nr:MAG: hypothetical protein M1818_006120 [Claussenomyces sp. TS43310]
MSASKQPEGPVEKKGLSKYVMRMKNAFKDSHSKRRSTVAAPAPASTQTKAGSSKVAVSRVPTKHDRIRTLADKYDIDLGTLEWNDSPVGERVEKAIRMRIHRSCHRCGTAFGANRMCVSCGHSRCQSCPRYPKKKVAGGRQPSKGAELGTVTIERPSHYKEAVAARKATGRSTGQCTGILTMPSKSGGPDLVRKKPKQRIRRTCHCCEAPFPPGDKICPSCSHIRCWDCPREPAKALKYPDGYPGDTQPDPDPSAPPDRPRRVIRYLCHDCKATFKTGDATCPGCGHERCAECPKVPPKKVQPEPDAEILRRVQERLAAMSLAGTKPAETRGLGAAASGGRR